MKKLYAFLLALALCLALCVPALATEQETPAYEDMSTVTLTKMYALTNAGTASPAEEFTFTIERDAVSDAAEGITAANMPMPSIGTVSYAQGEAGSATAAKEITITLPTYTSVGIYTYIIKETGGDTAGVTYFGKNIRLVVTVIELNGKIRVAAVHTEDEGENKSDTITNTYSAGNLAVTKHVTGLLGDKNKYFEVTVTLTGKTGETYAGSFAVSGGSDSRNPAAISLGTATRFYLKDGETVTIANLPYGVSYTVAESDYTGTNGGYDAPSYEYGDETRAVDSAVETVAITNNKGATVDAGVMLDSAPYVLALAGVCGIGTVTVLRKRRSAER